MACPGDIQTSALSVSSWWKEGPSPRSVRGLGTQPVPSSLSTGSGRAIPSDRGPATVPEASAGKSHDILPTLSWNSPRRLVHENLIILLFTFLGQKEGLHGRGFKSIMQQVMAITTMKATLLQCLFAACPVLSTSHGQAWSSSRPPPWSVLSLSPDRGKGQRRGPQCRPQHDGRSIPTACAEFSTSKAI